jgi:hypothetical protein
MPQYEADGITITAHGTGLLQDVWQNCRSAMSPAQQRANEILSRIKPNSRGAEIGVFAGDLSRELLKAGHELIMVDSWEGDGRAYQGDSGDWHATLTEGAQDDFMERTKKRVKFANGRARIIRKRSVEALADVPDASLDFVFIDADHSKIGCENDLNGWVLKLKPGGLLSGHDYRNPDFIGFGVTEAVDAFVVKHHLNLEIGENFTYFIRIPEWFNVNG